VYDYLAALNESQREAVENYKGASLVIAGAGSGKTRVLTFRIAHLLRNGSVPSKVLALTFTNKAAREMKNRIAAVVGEQTARYLWMGTFHSVFSKILRIEAAALQYPETFTIYDTTDTKSLLKTIIKDFKLDDTLYKPGEMLSRISSAKNNLITWESYINNPSIFAADNDSKKPEVGKIYREYALRCKKAGAMDFDDLLLNTNVLFRDHPEILEKYQKKFDYILVDEYQDTNYSQYLIIKKLSEKHGNICVVGDDAQSIYAFRGAQIENILNFRNDYKNFSFYKLEQNYRSTKIIVAAANEIIANNKNQIQKLVYSENEEGNKIKLLVAYTDHEEGNLIASAIWNRNISEHCPFSDFAILYRTNAQSRILEDMLRKRNIAYKIYGGTSFYQRKEIKDVISYMRLAVNPLDDEAFKRIVNYPKRGIGDTTIEKLEEAATKNGISIWHAVEYASKLQIAVNKPSLVKVNHFRNMILEFRNKLEHTDAYTLAREIATKSGILQDLYAEKTVESLSRHENVQELLNAIKEFSDQREVDASELTLSKYLENVALLTDDDKSDKSDTNRVALMTIHSAKGLEFKHVFISGLEEDLFPSKMMVESLKDLEEERRLFYVAITRAEKNLTISYARTRLKWGKYTDSVPSRFIKELNPEYIEQTGDRFTDKLNGSGNPFSKRNFDHDYIDELPEPSKPIFQKRTETKPQPAAFKKPALSRTEPAKPSFAPKADFVPDDLRSLAVGNEVEHDRFGFGKVTVIEGAFPNIKATIVFNEGGEKVLLLKFAKLRILK